MFENWQRLGALRRLCMSGLQMEELEIPKEFIDVIHPTAKGTETLSLLQEPLTDLKGHEMKFVLFLLLGLKGEFIDCSLTDIGAIESFINEVIVTRKIVLPYVY